MPISSEAMELENQSLGAHGAATLGPAYVLLRGQWKRGDRDRELALHLMFLAWYLAVEPPYSTGADEALVPSDELQAVFNEVHDCLLPYCDATNDAEALYAVGLAAHMFPWALGDEQLWMRRSKTYRARYRQLLPDGIDPAQFDGRGAYGVYYGGQARVGGGY